MNILAKGNSDPHLQNIRIAPKREGQFEKLLTRNWGQN